MDLEICVYFFKSCSFYNKPPHYLCLINNTIRITREEKKSHVHCSTYVPIGLQNWILISNIWITCLLGWRLVFTVYMVMYLLKQI